MKYHPTMCETVKAVLSRGHTQAVLCAELGIHRKTLNEWRGKYPEFEEAYLLAMEQCESVNELIGRQNLFNKHFNTSLWIFIMKARFGWRDRDPSTHLVVNQDAANMARNQALADVSLIMKDLPKVAY